MQKRVGSEERDWRRGGKKEKIIGR